MRIDANMAIVDAVSTQSVRRRVKLTKNATTKRTIFINGHKTSVSLENEFWHALRAIAEKKSTTAAKLIEEINLSRRGSNLSSALRVFVCTHFRPRDA